MGTNASIPLSYQSPQFANPADVAQRAFSLRHLMQQSELQRQQIDAVNLENKAREDAMNAQKKMAQLVAENSTQGANGQLVTDHGSVLRGLAESGYGNAALKYDADRRANEGALIKNAKEQLDNSKAKVEQFASLLNGVVQAPETDKQRYYDMARTTAIQNGLASPEQVPTVYDPDYVKTHHLAAVTATQSLEQHQRDLDYGLRLNEFDHKLATDAPKTEEAWQQHASQILGAATNQAQWEAGIHRLQAAYDRANPPQSPAPGQPAAPTQPPAFLAGINPTFSTDELKKVQNLGMTAEQREMHEDRQFNQQANRDLRQDSLDLRRDLAEQAMALRKTLADERLAGAGGRKLTPGQLLVEERNISQLENGTSARPGLNSQRLKYGAMLTPRKGTDGKPSYDRKDAKGRDIWNSDGSLTDAGEEVKAQLDAATDALQATQYRKAKLYGIESPDPQDVAAAKDGEELQASDGSAWRKSGGVAFYKGAAGSSAPAAAASAPATPQAPPQRRTAPERQEPAGDKTPTAAQPKAAPASPPQSVVDGLTPGLHTFRNGQTWRKNADGSMQFVSQK